MDNDLELQGNMNDFIEGNDHKMFRLIVKTCMDDGNGSTDAAYTK